MIGRLSRGQMIAAIGAVVLLVAMFLPWWGISVSTGGVTIPQGIQLPQGVNVPSSVGGSHTENVWKGSTLDIYLLITAVVALLPALLALTDSAEEFSFVSAATFLLGVVAVILIIAFMTVDFPPAGDTKYGCWIGGVAALVIAYGGFRSMQEEVVGEI
jgi:hypothetical protein